VAEKRVVAVLGESPRRGDGLHPMCADRLALAQALSPGALAVIFSGWARRPKLRSEAELMRESWTGTDVEVVCDPDARSTAENVANVVADARRLGADELVVVTSRWHRPRARLLLWAATRGKGLRPRVEAAPGPRPLSLVARELACIPLLPLQVLRARRNPSNE
jgi:hypothetical protein